MTVARLGFVLLAVWSACRSKPDTGDRERPGAIESPPVAVDSAVVPVPMDSDRAGILAAPDTAAPQPPTEGEAVTAPDRQDVRAATVQAVLDSEAFVGSRVRITGRCVGYTTRIALGGPPVTRSDWQLEDEGMAIYVSGPLPEGCSPTGRSTEAVTILAVVRQDTLPAVGSREPIPRRYLLTIAP